VGRPGNQPIAEKLREAASILEEQQANPFRVRAYRRAADTIAELDEDLHAIVARAGYDGLRGLPGIGGGIAAALHEMVRTGRWSQLERLRGALDPEKLLQSVPGIGPTLARRIHETLEIDTLAGLELAAHDGRLSSVRGVGARRGAMIRAQLGAMLGRAKGWQRTPGGEPAVETLLDVDAEYRRRAAVGGLLQIAPRRFNPTGEAWLPVLHAERGAWYFTALYSNTAQAHTLGRTHDWVVIYFHTDHEPEGQRTVVTEVRGPLAGQRVVRGRENECRAHYAA